MIVTSVKMSTFRVATVLFLLGIIIAVALWPRGEAVEAVQNEEKYTGISTNEKRVSFIESYGWKVDKTPLEVVEVTIPTTFGAVYRNYNAIQKNQGFDLSNYKGKRVKRWTYKITNYPGVSEEVRANILIYNDRVIGGDVSTVALNGFMHGLSPRNASNPATGTTAPQDADITSGIFKSISQ